MAGPYKSGAEMGFTHFDVYCDIRFQTIHVTDIGELRRSGSSNTVYVYCPHCKKGHIAAPGHLQSSLLTMLTGKP